MNLDSFVEQSIRQIMAGVNAAQLHAAEFGGDVNPERLSVSFGSAPAIPNSQVSRRRAGSSPDTWRPATMLDFDIAVAASEATGKEGGITVMQAITGRMSKETEQSTISRLRFQVPLILPLHKAE